MDKITIIGAGLCGSLLGLRLAQLGYEVHIFEKRPDLRTTDISSGRSINLALSNRGLRALELVGVTKQALELAIPMYGRLIHDIKGNTFTSDYSGRNNEYINSISRQDLTAMLLDQADIYDNLTINFNVKCIAIDIEEKIATFRNSKDNSEFSVSSRTIFGADGAGSILRKSFIEEQKFLFNYSQEYLTHGYKEIEIPAGKNKTHLISKHHLHIWPRGDFMLIALPNLDGSFTMTLFLAKSKGDYNFNKLNSKKEILKFFKDQFPDVISLIPNILDEFKTNPTSPLGTIKCGPWHYKGNTLLMGDAAHAIVPFYGQGMNASFEDVLIFDKALSRYKGNWKKIFEYYQEIRKKDTDAIADLAIENYYEMRDHVTDPLFKEKRKLEMTLEKKFPKRYFSKYSLVTFNDTIGYHQARVQGNAQDKAILKCLKDNSLKKLNPKETLERINKITQQILDEQNYLEF